MVDLRSSGNENGPAVITEHLVEVRHDYQVAITAWLVRFVLRKKMKHLINCPNAGEAGLIQSMLASNGIDAEVRDGRSDIGAIPSAQVFVTPEQHAQALGLIAPHHAAEPVKPSGPAHPAEGFPFLGIMGFTALLWSLVGVVMSVVSIDPDSWRQEGAGSILLSLLAVGALSLLWGLMIGALIALICLIAKVTWRRLKSDPAVTTQRH